MRIRLVIFCCFVLFFGGHRPFSFLHTTHSLVRPDRARPNANAKKEKGRGTTKKNEQFGKKKTKEKKRGSGKSTSPQSGCGAAVTQIVFLLLFRHHRHSLVKKKRWKKRRKKPRYNPLKTGQRKRVCIVNSILKKNGSIVSTRRRRWRRRRRRRRRRRPKSKSRESGWGVGVTRTVYRSAINLLLRHPAGFSLSLSLSLSLFFFFSLSLVPPTATWSFGNARTHRRTDGRVTNLIWGTRDGDSLRHLVFFFFFLFPPPSLC